MSTSRRRPRQQLQASSPALAPTSSPTLSPTLSPTRSVPTYAAFFEPNVEPYIVIYFKPDVQPYVGADVKPNFEPYLVSSCKRQVVSFGFLALFLDIFVLPVVVFLCYRKAPMSTSRRRPRQQLQASSCKFWIPGMIS